jgi:hypothetical protein
LLGDAATDLQIVGWLILKDGIAAKIPETLAGCADGGAQGKLDSFKLPIDEDSWVEVGQHANFLKALDEGGLAGWHVETGDCADVGILERRNKAAEVIWLNADIAVADDEVLK